MAKDAEASASKPKYRVRAEVQPGHPGLFRGGRFWSSSAWTSVELSAREAAILESDKRLMVELDTGPKNADKAKSEALEVAKELAAEKAAHAATKTALDIANKEIDRLQDGIATAKQEAIDAKAETESFKERIREQAKTDASKDGEKPKG
jgi:enoyl-CoA hydratase/carnithine racemase